MEGLTDVVGDFIRLGLVATIKVRLVLVQD